MVERLPPLQDSGLHDGTCGDALPRDSAHRGDQDTHSFIYANCSLGLFPADPVEFAAFAKGQLIAIAMFAPAALALFACLAR